MRIVGDFHIHSPYARAVSKDMTLENLDHWARLKGITVMGTGDFTHPKWIREIKTKLEPAEPGLYRLKQQYSLDKDMSEKRPVRFMLTVEISSIYSKNGKTRRVHTLIFVPSIETAERINTKLGWEGNIKSDGRPILGLGAKEVAKIALEADPRCFVVPAHAWTPWFSVFGSMSGFDSLEECFEELTPHIKAIETGLSSDPEMNWQWSKLDHIALISNSDSHSLKRIGREANVFNTELSYDGIIRAITSHDPSQFLSTIEFFPEEGKYHYDGHRVCQFSCHPSETKKLNNRCPKCEKAMTIGVLNRVAVLADRPLGGKPERIIPFKRLVPLDEIIAESFDMGTSSKKVHAEYLKLTNRFDTELVVLLDASRRDLEHTTSPDVVEGIIRVREGRVRIHPGYDGEYGTVHIFDDDERRELQEQATLL